jgi:hypothetical protein
MKTEILYVELIQQYDHQGPAWIGYGQFSKSGRTVYFNGKVFGRGRSPIGNHIDIESGEEYWISGIKKNGEDRHRFGSGKIFIDKSVIEDYLEITGETNLQKNKFVVVELVNLPNKELSRRIENKKLTSHSFNKDLLETKNPRELKNDDLEKVIRYYSKMDVSEYSSKALKAYNDKLDILKTELDERKQQ